MIYSWVYIKRTNKNVFYIIAIESFIKGENIGTDMLNHYINYYNLNERQIILIPSDIISTAAKFWAKYFLNTYCINNKNELGILLQEYEITYDLEYKHLYNYWEQLDTYYKYSK